MARSNLGWEPSKMEQYAERYWLVNGYDAKLIKRYISKSIYEISKDGLIDGYEVPNTVKDPARFMDEFERYWDILKKTAALRKQVHEAHSES